MREDKPEAADVADLPSMEPFSPSAKAEETAETSLKKEGATESDLPEESKAKDDNAETSPKKEDNEGVIVRSEQGAAMGESEEKPAAVQGVTDEGQTSSKAGTELKAVSDAFSEDGSYFETSSESPQEESSRNQSYYELGTAGETKLQGESVVQKLDRRHETEAGTSPGKVSLGQRSLSLNIATGSSGGQAGNGEKSKALPEKLCPISGSFDGSEVYPSTPSLESQHHFHPAVSVTPTAAETSEGSLATVGTPSSSDEQESRFYHSGSFSETLDLAGALPLPSLERRELDYMRRKSVPTNVSALVGSSLADLALGDHTLRVGGESQLEELGYCVLSEYSGPMPSPADVPSPVVSPEEQFPSAETEIEEDPGPTEVKSDPKVLQQRDQKGIVPENPPKQVYEKKNIPVKTTLILEKAVTSGVKPDRLRIPMTSTKDRLTDFRLESGLPGDLKIQAIPEVDNEKDPSRETSPIPPDNSFTFTLTEIGSKVPRTPTTPKSPNETPSEIAAEEARKGVLTESERIDNKLDEQTQKSEEGCESLEGKEIHDKKIQSEHFAPTRPGKKETLITVEESSTKKPQMQPQGVIVNKCPPKPHLSPTVIIIPQAQVEEEGDEEDDIEIAEEPQEIMVDVETPTKAAQSDESASKEAAKEEQKSERVRLMVVDRAVEDDPRSGAEDWSHSGQNSDDGEPATDSSHLSPWSDHGQPVEGVGEERAAGVANRDKCERDSGEAVKEDRLGKQEAEGVVPEAAGKERKQKTVDEREEVDKGVEMGQEVGEAFDVLCQAGQAADDETTVEDSLVDTDSGWMDSQGTQNL